MAPTSTSGRAAPMTPERRRAALVGSTLALIRQHGTDVSTRQIAEAAGVAEGRIFRVFPNKDALLCAAKEAAFDPAPVVQQLRSIPAEQPLEQRLLQAATILQEQLRSVIELLTVLRLSRPPGGGHPGPPGHAPSHTPDNAPILGALAHVVRPDRVQLSGPPERVAGWRRLVCFPGSPPRIATVRP